MPIMGPRNQEPGPCVDRLDRATYQFIEELIGFAVLNRFVG